MNKIILISFFTLVSCTLLSANHSNRFWKDIEYSQKSVIKVDNPRYLALSFDEMKQYLDSAPLENILQGFSSNFEVIMPLPDGSFETFLIEQTQLMENKLATKYPGIKTFTGYSKKTNLRRITLDYTYKGIHALITYPGNSIYIDPISLTSKTEYICYYKDDFYSKNVNQKDFIEYDVVYPEETEIHLPHHKPTGDELLTYRLAVATTGEYGTYHGGNANDVLSAVQTTIARVNSVYEVELAVRLILIDNTDTLFYYNGSTDPYTNNSGSTLLGENQAEVDEKIGSENYDIGHVFSTGGGGIASYASVCNDSRKAQGVTGSFNPIGDPFDIDYVAHEIGHQFSGSHTFDGLGGSCGGGNRSANTAYEPGSGSTIMAYAGICGSDNLQNNSDAFFHVGSFVEMTNFIHSGSGRNCAQIIPTGNTKPTVNANPENKTFVIPIETPFEVFGEATDPDGDSLTYIWEGYDKATNGSPVNFPGENSALFRSYTPLENGQHRMFPRLFNILNNNTPKGEKLPYSDRILKLRLTARDNRAAGGGVAWAEREIEVTTSAGPFYITQPDSLGDTFEANDLNVITWEVANTDKGLISAEFVDVYLSLDNGNTFDILLLEKTENDGFQVVFIDDSLAGQTNCRIKIKASENIFFDISNNRFSITEYDGIPNPDPTSTQEVISKNMISIYPNPTKETIFIKSNIEIDDIEITNILGQKIEFIFDNKSKLDIKYLEKGVYFIKIKLQNGVIHQERIVKN